MPEVRDLESKNLHNQMWTFTNKGEESLLDKIFKGDSPFDSISDINFSSRILHFDLMI